MTSSPALETPATGRLAAHEPSYCCQSNDTSDATQAVTAWIAARESEGWTVRFSVRQDPSGKLGVMWHCVSHADGRYNEFTPAIGMSGREFQAN